PVGPWQPHPRRWRLHPRSRDRVPPKAASGLPAGTGCDRQSIVREFLPFRVTGAELRGNWRVTLAPSPGALRTASVPPRSAARSRMPAKPNDIGWCRAVSAQKPAPLSATLSLILLSAVDSERFTRVA